MIHILRSALIISFVGILVNLTIAQNHSSGVRVIGEMKDVMWKGEVQGKISLDSLSGRKHLYGFGPAEFLQGELLIVDGVSFISRVAGPEKMIVNETFSVKAPFFAYGYVHAWRNVTLNNDIVDLKTLEKFLSEIAQGSNKPFFFQLKGKVENAMIHVVNLPSGTKISVPQDAHQGQVNFRVSKQTVTVIGFYSKNHQGIFTHHDTSMHLHLITDDKGMMGHVDELKFDSSQVMIAIPADK